MDARVARFLIPALLAACGAPTVAIEGNTVRAPNGVAFRVGDVPSDWRRVKADDSALGFNDPSGATVMVDGRCDLRSDDVPLVALTNQLVAGATDRKYEKEEVVPFDGREARHTILRAKLDGVPLVWDVYVMKKNGCVYDLAYVASPEAFEQGAAPFERFVAGFHTVGEAP